MYAVIFDIYSDSLGRMTEECFGYYDTPLETAQRFREAYPFGMTENEKVVLVLKDVDYYLQREVRRKR